MSRSATSWLLAVPAAAFALLQEGRIRRSGQPLDAAGLEVARRLGVRDPARVRVLTQPQIANPLASAVRFLERPAAGAPGGAGPRPRPWTRIAARLRERGALLTGEIAGMALGHGIVVIDEPSPGTARALLAHELAHVAQYERLGSRFGFLREYIRQCLTHGYANAPLEREACAAAEASLSSPV
jgi:hypothetical protein